MNSPPTPRPSLSFKDDIRTRLFRVKDRNAMLSDFDLWDYDDVKANAKDIYQQVSLKRMPCDGPWPDADIAKFKAWMDGGMMP